MKLLMMFVVLVMFVGVSHSAETTLLNDETIKEESVCLSKLLVWASYHSTQSFFGYGISRPTKQAAISALLINNQPCYVLELTKE